MAFGKTVQNNTKTTSDVCIDKVLTFINLDSKRFCSTNFEYDLRPVFSQKCFNGNGYRDNFLLAFFKGSFD